MAAQRRALAAEMHARFDAAIAAYWRGLGLNVGVAEAAPEDESGTEALVSLAVDAALDQVGVKGLGNFASRLLTRGLSETEVRERVMPFAALSSVLALTMQKRWDTASFTQLALVISADGLKPAQLRDRVSMLIDFASGLQEISPRQPLESRPRPLFIYPLFTFASSAAYERALSTLWMPGSGATFSPDDCADVDVAAARLAPWPLVMGNNAPTVHSDLAAWAAKEHEPGDITAWVSGVDLRRRRISGNTVLHKEDLPKVFHLYDTLEPPG